MFITHYKIQSDVNLSRNITVPSISWQLVLNVGISPVLQVTRSHPLRNETKNSFDMGPQRNGALKSWQLIGIFSEVAESISNDGHILTNGSYASSLSIKNLIRLL